MLRSVNDLKGLSLRATDGEIGSVDQFYFDDETWTIRYLEVNAGNWLVGRRVLISPISLGTVDWTARQLEVALTRKQVENSPNIDTHKPVSRQHEAEFLGYYGYPFYWGGTHLWGPVLHPADLSERTIPSEAPLKAKQESIDRHLRSTDEVSGAVVRSVEPEEPPTLDMERQPTESASHRALKPRSVRRTTARAGTRRKPLPRRRRTG